VLIVGHRFILFLLCYYMSYVDIVVLFIFRGNIVEASYILFCEKGHCRKILYFIHAPLCSIAKKKLNYGVGHQEDYH
jgi:hypothetical protein